MTSAAKFWNRMARRYAASPIADEAAYERKLEMTRAHFSPDSNVFEFGCGTGSTALLHAEHVGHVDAIDFSEEMIAIAEERKAKAQVDNVDFHVASIVDFAGENDRYDVVMGMSVLHLLEKPEEEISKSFQMLKPGGVFVSSTVCLTGARRAIVPIAAFLRRFNLLPILKGFSPDALRQMILDPGFEIEEFWQPGPGAAVFIIAKKPT